VVANDLAVHHCARRAAPLAAAVVVGTLLNLINQGDALFSGRHINWLKLGLTYIVPYCVATYGAVAFRLEAMRRETRPRN
jgi:purine-cytosine permease-like protein